MRCCRLLLTHLLYGFASIQAEVSGQRADEVGAESSTRLLPSPASMSNPQVQTAEPNLEPNGCPRPLCPTLGARHPTLPSRGQGRRLTRRTWSKTNSASVSAPSLFA